MPELEENKMRLTQSMASLIVIVWLCLSSCIEYSPFETEIDTQKANLTAMNIAQIPSASGAFQFAVISDSHGDYEELADCVAHINNNSELSFVIHAGDMTDIGLRKEYIWFEEIISQLSLPYLTVIGNHDCLSNGKQIYRQMYGNFNYSIEYSGSKFIFFNDNNREITGKVLDLDWLAGEFSEREQFNHIFVIAHVLPWGDELKKGEEGKKLAKLFEERGTSMVILGHAHRFLYGELNNDGVKYLISNDVKDRDYCIVTVDSANVSIERVFIQ